jgi:hypothetical protein
MRRESAALDEKRCSFCRVLGRNATVVRMSDEPPKPVLRDHQRQGKRLVPPLMQLPQLRPVSWFEQMLPDFLWIGALLGRRCDWRAVNSALDVLDQYVPDGKRVLDGRISSFALVPEKRRAEAREALFREARHAVPTAFGQALRLYPESPASWLYDDRGDAEADPEVGLPLLRSLVSEGADRSGAFSTRLRLIPIARLAKHGKFKFPAGSGLENVPKYPRRLSTEEQRELEAVIRATWGALFGMDSAENPDVLEWPKHFWLESRVLVPCKLGDRQEEITMPEKDGPLEPEPLMQVSEMYAVLIALRELGEQLRSIQSEQKRDPEQSSIDAVLLGFASRLFRLFYSFMERPSAWTPSVSSVHLRPIIDARLVSAWLIKKDDPSMFADYVEHGLGRLKLLKEHVEADLGDQPDPEAKEFLDSLDRRVNLEILDWFQPVNLGSYADVSPRDMAIEAGLKREYDLAYAPLSGEAHGDWPAIRENDTQLCEEPLHGRHRLGRFVAPSRVVSAKPVELAYEWTRDGITAIFNYLGTNVDTCFDRVRGALDDALYESPDDAGDS